MLDHWAASPRGRLALIILLDQFPRHCFRGMPEAYASDAEGAGARGRGRRRARGRATDLRGAAVFLHAAHARGGPRSAGAQPRALRRAARCRGGRARLRVRPSQDRLPLRPLSAPQQGARPRVFARRRRRSSRRTKTRFASGRSVGRVEHDLVVPPKTLEKRALAILPPTMSPMVRSPSMASNSATPARRSADRCREGVARLIRTAAAPGGSRS